MASRHHNWIGARDEPAEEVGERCFNLAGLILRLAKQNGEAGSGPMERSVQPRSCPARPQASARPVTAPETSTGLRLRLA